MENNSVLRTVVRVALPLLLICLVVSALVALVYGVTAGPIAEGERARKEQAIRLIFADAASFEEGTAPTTDGVNAAYTVKNEAGTVIGYCVDYTGTSDYGGDVNMMIGVGTDGKVLGLQVISHAETFIDRYTDDKGRYTGVDAPRGSDVSAGATLSYNALRNAIEAIEAMEWGGAQ
jgi:electron transport complex protein RnfG